MDVKIYQINPERDANRVKFMSFKNTLQRNGNHPVDSSIYDEVFHAPMENVTPEGLFTQFNTTGHPLHRGHSLSVSDVVVLDGKAHFCDSIGFKEVPFVESLTQKPEGLLRVLYVEPHKPAYEAEIEHSLEAMQRAVIGCIEPIYLTEGICLVGNEEAKLIGMEGNRRIFDGQSIIAGPFFVVGDHFGEFCSLTDEEVETYLKEFAHPHDISPDEVEADSGFFFLSM